MSVLLVAAPVVTGVVLFILLSKKLDKLGENMAARDDVQAIGAQLSKAADEIVGKIADLDAKIADGTVTADDLAPVREAAQRLDDIVPDVDETPVDGGSEV